MIAGTAFTMAAAAWALTAGHAASGLEQNLLIAADQLARSHRRELWLVYVALEPYVRRNWPDALVSWTRLCHGQARNPVVASHILAGIVAAEAFGLIVRPGFTGAERRVLGIATGVTTFSLMLGLTLLVLTLGLVFALVAVLLQQFTGRPMLAGLAVAVMFSIPAGFEAYGHGPFGRDALLRPVHCRQHGLAVAAPPVRLLDELDRLAGARDALAWPLTITGWFAGRSMAVHLVPVTVAAWALWVILSMPTY